MALHVMDSEYPQIGANITGCWEISTRELKKAVKEGQMIYLHPSSGQPSVRGGVIESFTEISDGTKCIIFEPLPEGVGVDWPGSNDNQHLVWSA